MPTRAPADPSRVRGRRVSAMTSTRSTAHITPAFARGVVRAVASHPSLWPTAIRQLARMTPPRWWTRRPFLPVPDADYLRFRLETQYGFQPESSDVMAPDDVVVYLRWCQASGR